MKWTLFAVAAVAVLLVAPRVADATDLFGVEATYSGGTITQTASSLPNLIEALINNQGAFAPLLGNDFTGSLTYYGIPGAVAVAVQGDTQLTITSPLTGLDRTFTGTSRNDLEDQLKDWLLKEGSNEVGQLIQAVAEHSAAAITDGNPSSMTARMADRAFGTFGLFPANRVMRGSEPGHHAGLWFHTRQSQAETPVGTADTASYEIHVPWWLNFGRHVSLIGGASGQYMDTEGTAVYGGGSDLGLGIRPFVRDEQSHFGWQVTPFVGLHAMGTYDGATGGLLNQFGIASRLEFQLPRGILLIVANQFSHFNSLRLKIKDVNIDPMVEQNVLKNGLMVDVPLWADKSLYANGFFADTRFLQDAAVDNYQTLGAGLSLRGDRMSLNVYVSRDFAGDYRSWNAGAGLSFGL
ncbi:MAG: hypothetical protein FJ280_28230 [Planctomycetes bacterium]|nr:hypothetical protein [Planctomycetota bacterium]